MNQIHIYEPRWHDRVVLVADRKLVEHNEIIIDHKEFPRPFYLSGKVAKEYPLMQMPTKNGGTIAVREIPLSAIEKESLDV